MWQEENGSCEEVENPPHVLPPGGKDAGVVSSEGAFPTKGGVKEMQKFLICIDPALGQYALQFVHDHLTPGMHCISGARTVTDDSQSTTAAPPGLLTLHF